VKTARLRSIFLVRPEIDGNFTEQSSGSFTTKMGRAGLFLETIITSVLTPENSAILNIPPTTSQSLALRASPGVFNDAPTKLVCGYL
jgi:hypothetical protein